MKSYVVTYHERGVVRAVPIKDGAHFRSVTISDVDYVIHTRDDRVVEVWQRGRRRDTLTRARTLRDALTQQMGQ